jgi:hypothetical protein
LRSACQYRSRFLMNISVNLAGELFDNTELVEKLPGYHT